MLHFLPTHDDLFNPSTVASVVAPWKPHALAHNEWPDRDYTGVYAWRMETLAKLRANPKLLEDAKRYYSTRYAEFIMHWMDTYDPRLQGSKWVPFVFFAKQAEVVEFLHEMRTTSENGLFEKARDMGLTWLCCGYSVASWLFIANDTIGWGSRKRELVDRIGDPSSIFEKLRMLIRRLPDVFRPEGLKEKVHLKSMNLVNPANGATIIGEIGDSIGRGGRTSMYFKDESAHYENPESIQASLDDNTRVQIDISSVNGLGNVFHRRRVAGEIWHRGHEIKPMVTRVFIVDWRDHPEKDQAWYDARKAKAVREGLQHIFAQEVDRDYSAAMQNRIIDFEWIEAAVDAHLKVPCLQIPPPNAWMSGLDVADEGGDRNAQAIRQWRILRFVDEWGDRDQGITCRRALGNVEQHKGIQLQYDCIGVGVGVKTEYNRLIDDGKWTREKTRLVPWSAAYGVLDPYEHLVPGDEDTPFNIDHFQNFKAQAWWALRTSFYKTWRAVTQGDVYDADELISLDSEMPLLVKLKEELAQPQMVKSTHMKLMVDKVPDGTFSPNLADAVVMCYFPAPFDEGNILLGRYSG